MAAPPPPPAAGLDPAPTTTPTATITTPTTGIVPSDPAKPFRTTPLLADLVRTRDCPPGPILLVEAVDGAVTVSARYRAVRLVLGDGRLCVQALLAAELHVLVDEGVVYEGCYVRLDGFALRFYTAEGVSVDGNGADPASSAAAAPPPPPGQRTAYLRVDALTVVGWNETYMEVLRRGAEEAMADGEDEDGEDENGEAGHVEVIEHDSARPGTEGIPLATAEPRPEVPSVDLDDDFPLDSDVEDAFESMDVSPTRATQRRQAVSRPAAVLARPWASDDPTQPLKLTPLGSVPKLPYQQNWMVNVLGVIVSLSDVEPTLLLSAPNQRTARLADPSTGKRVLLTVFLDPEAFSPRVGSVVLLLGLKNHRFDGGCLKKYASDQPKGGERWWFEEPDELEWCDVRGLREWWGQHGQAQGHRA